MCGIIGIRDGDISQLLYTGLYAIQHRGQDSAGMLTYNDYDGKFRVHKGRGLVTKVFDEESLKSLRGEIGIAQVRYPTIGSDFEKDAQPFWSIKPSKIGIAHNGNIANYAEMRKRFNSSFESQCDVEAVLYSLGENYRKTKDIFHAAEESMKELSGSYSVVAAVPGEGLVIFRDPHAIRPLVMSGNGAASESIALDLIGEKVERDVLPGECIVMGNDGRAEAKQVMKSTPRHCMFEWVYFSRPDSTIEKRSVYDVRVRLGKELAKRWKGAADVVVPVPDTSRPVAAGFSEESGVPCREGLIKNRYVGRTFIMPSQKSRVDAVRVKLNPIIQEVRGKRVVLIDDSIVRGTTCANLITLLRDAGAKEVHFLVSCPPIYWPCFYGVDMTRKSELVAAGYKPGELERDFGKKIGADSLMYQTVEGLRSAIGVKGLCTACIDGDYPTDVSALLKKGGEGRPYELD